MDDLKAKKRARDGESESPAPESDTDSPEVKRLRRDLLDFDDDNEFCTASQDLDSFMKSFEDEIGNSPCGGVAGDATTAVDLTSDGGDSRPDLGYLLEASDDDLGLPPTGSSELKSELVQVDSDDSELGGEFWEIPSYDSLGFGFGETESFNGGNGEYVAIDGLFDFGSSDFSWRPETLPAQ